jgi:hypothetical protein
MLRRSVLFVAVIGIATALVAANVETISRVFTLEHASVSDVSNAVQPLLSEAGSLTLQPKLSRIVVQDQPAILDRVTALIEELDHVPDHYSIEIELLEGTEPRPYGTRDEIEAEGRLREMFNVEAFHRLGRSVVEGELGNQAQAGLGDEFRVSFLAQASEVSKGPPWGTPDVGSRLSLRPLVLERLEVSTEGELTAHELLRTNVLISQKQTVYIGAGNSEDSANVLVLIVHAMETGSR